MVKVCIPLAVAEFSSSLRNSHHPSEGTCVARASCWVPDDVAVVGQAVQQGRGHLGIAEHAGPFGKRQIGGDHHAGTRV